MKMHLHHDHLTDTLFIFFSENIPAKFGELEYRPGVTFLLDSDDDHFIGIGVRHASTQLPTPEEGTEWSESDVRVWLATTLPPELFPLKVNEKALNEHLAALEVQGIEITPDIIPGITLHRVMKLNGPDWEIESSMD